MPARYDFEESVGYWTAVASQAFQRAINEELSPHGVTFRQAQVLAWLKHGGELSQTDLALRMMIEPPTLVGILDRMERDGWIARVGCAGDRRKKMIRALPTADAVWEKIAEIGLAVRARATADMSADELDLFKRMLRKMHANLADAPAIHFDAAAEPAAIAEDDTVGETTSDGHSNGPLSNGNVLKGNGTIGNGSHGAVEPPRTTEQRAIG